MIRIQPFSSRRRRELGGGAAAYATAWGPAPGKTVPTSHGTTHYLLEGPTNADSPVVVLLAGLGAGMRFWDAFAQALAAAGHRVLRLDFYDRGWSESDPKRYPITTLGEVCKAAPHQQPRVRPTGLCLAPAPAGVRRDAVRDAAAGAAGGAWTRKHAVGVRWAQHRCRSCHPPRGGVPKERARPVPDLGRLSSGHQAARGAPCARPLPARTRPPRHLPRRPPRDRHAPPSGRPTRPWSGGG